MDCSESKAREMESKTEKPEDEEFKNVIFMTWNDLDQIITNEVRHIMGEIGERRNLEAKFIILDTIISNNISENGVITHYKIVRTITEVCQHLLATYDPEEEAKRQEKEDEQFKQEFEKEATRQAVVAANSRHQEYNEALNEEKKDLLNVALFFENEARNLPSNVNKLKQEEKSLNIKIAQEENRCKKLRKQINKYKKQQVVINRRRAILNQKLKVIRKRKAYIRSLNRLTEKQKEDIKKEIVQLKRILYTRREQRLHRIADLQYQIDMEHQKQDKLKDIVLKAKSVEEMHEQVKQFISLNDRQLRARE